MRRPRFSLYEVDQLYRPVQLMTAKAIHLAPHLCISKDCIDTGYTRYPVKQKHGALARSSRSPVELLPNQFLKIESPIIQKLSENHKGLKTQLRPTAQSATQTRLLSPEPPTHRSRTTLPPLRHPTTTQYQCLRKTRVVARH